MATEARPLSDRFTDALAFATAAHEGQGRKGTDTPYIAHLLGVTSIVLEHGGDEEQAIAALLHDAIEDQGGDEMRSQIRERFGERVTMMVDDCTDADVRPKPAWEKRKRDYLEHIAVAHTDSLLVSMADKLYNTAAIARDVRREGMATFGRFHADAEQTLWYYRSLVEKFEARDPQGPARDLLDEVARAVGELEEAIADASS